ncbi:MAG: signal peptidase I [Pseudomonadota bacterium]
MADKQPGELAENIKTIVYALLIALFIRAFLFQPFNIPSGSMIPTLLVGDYLFVSKYSYGYSRHSFPFSPPLFSGRILQNMPERGDIVVFKWPADGRTDYIKRLIGLPGDRIQVRGGELYVNEQAVPREPLPDYLEKDAAGNAMQVRQYRETMPGGTAYNVLDMNIAGPVDNTGVFTVPAGHVFMMGDNRDNSTDSRVVNGGVGYVPVENLVGRAEFLFFSTDGSAQWWEFWRWFQAARFERMFRSINSVQG